MTTEPIRTDLRAYLAEQQETAALPAQYRPSVPVAVPERAMLPADLIAGLLAHERARGQEMTALAVQNAQLRAELVTGTRMSGKAKDRAALVLCGGVGTGAAASGVGFACGVIASASAGLMTAAVASAVFVGSAAVGKLVFRGAGAVFAPRGLNRPQVGSTYITNNQVTAKGMFAKAIGGPTSNG